MPTLRDTYRQGLSALLADADRLGRTPDDIAARAVVLAELRHAIAAGLGEEAPDKGAPWFAEARTTGTPVTDGPMSWGLLTELRDRAFDTSRAVPVEQPKPSKVRLVWGKEDGNHYLAPTDISLDGAYYSTAGRYAFRFPDGGLDDDRRVPVDSIAHGLRVITDLARADGYECDEHPDAAPATTAADAPTLPPGLRDEDGWIAWGGGACPCSDWPEVEYAIRDGDRGTEEPRFLIWTHGEQPHPGDILAYRRFR